MINHVLYPLLKWKRSKKDSSNLNRELFQEFSLKHLSNLLLLPNWLPQCLPKQAMSWQQLDRCCSDHNTKFFSLEKTKWLVTWEFHCKVYNKCFYIPGLPPARSYTALVSRFSSSKSHFPELHVSFIRRHLSFTEEPLRPKAWPIAAQSEPCFRRNLMIRISIIKIISRIKKISKSHFYFYILHIRMTKFLKTVLTL